MEPTRELDQIRVELDKLHDNAMDGRVELTALQITTDKRFDHILFCLEAMKKDIATLSVALASLQTLASEGQSSLRTLLWFGGAIASVTAFFIMIYSYLPK